MFFRHFQRKVQEHLKHTIDLRWPHEFEQNNSRRYNVRFLNTLFHGLISRICPYHQNDTLQDHARERQKGQNWHLQYIQRGSMG